MAKYLVCGTFGRGSTSRPFEKQIEAQSEKLARETAYSLLGSNGGIKRSAIVISLVRKL